MYAVVTTGGKQYRVEAGSELVIERLAADADASVTFDRVLMVGDGESVTVGTPTIDGATVSGTILREELGPKLIIFKFKQKATYRRTRGHRQHLVRVRIDEINANGKRSTADAAGKGDGASSPSATSAATEESVPAATRARKSTAASADGAADETKKPAPRRRSAARAAESKE